MADAAAIQETIQAILGDSPKSSLLFGAPAVSLRQLESSLALSSRSLPASEALHAAAHVASKIFGESKHAQLKTLVRGGKQEDWIVFRPSLSVSGGLKPPPPRTGGRPKDASGAATGVHQSEDITSRSGERSNDCDRTSEPAVATKVETEIVHDLPPLMPKPEAPKPSGRGKFLPPFLRSKTSQPVATTNTEIATSQVANPRNADPGSDGIALPPPHRIGSGDFGSLWVPVAATTTRETVQPPRTAYPSSRSGQNLTVSNGSTHPRGDDRERRKAPTSAKPRSQSSEPQEGGEDSSGKPMRPPLVDTKSTSRFPTIEPSHLRPPVQTFRPVDINIETSGIAHKKPVPPAPKLSIPGLPLPPSRADRETESIKTTLKGSDDSSLPYLSANPISQDVSPTSSAERPIKKAPDPNPDSADLNEIEKSLRALRPRQLTLAEGSKPVKLLVTVDDTPKPASPTLSSPPHSALSPLSSIGSPLLTPITPEFESEVSTPWLSVAFQDLPFGPDIPALQMIAWARARWQILCAEMVVILGAVYVIQALGI